MSSPEHEAYQAHLRAALRAFAPNPDHRRAMAALTVPILVLYHLDLTPALPALRAGYAPSPHGGNPWSPLPLFRALLLGHLIHTPQPSALAPRLRACPILRALAGFSPEEQANHTQPAPGASTFYDLFHRLFDGPDRAPCPHHQPPSAHQTARARSPRPPAQRPPNPTRTRRKKDARTTEADPARDVTAHLLQLLLVARDQRNAADFLNRLGELLWECGVVPSAQRGMLGDVRALIAAGDGSPLPSASAGDGLRTCECPRTPRCACPRRYSDPDARWGWDSHRETHFFGHHFYEVSVSSEGRDLPVHIRLDPATETDFTASLKALEWVNKTLRDHTDGWAIDIYIADKGHDSLATHQYLQGWGIRAVIPLANPAPATHPSRGTVFLSERGIPQCQAGIEMASWGTAGADKRPLFLCPLRAKKIPQCPLAPTEEPTWHCRPDLKYGPAVTLIPEDNPRLFPEIARNSARYEELFRLRSGTERSNSLKKGPYDLPRCRHRRWSFWVIRLYLAGLLQHAKAWVAQEDAPLFLATLLGERTEVAA